MAKIRIIDLTIDQIEQIERDSGVPLERWTEPAARLKAFRYIYAVATDTTPEDVGRLTLRELSDAITDDDDGEAGQDPDQG